MKGFLLAVQFLTIIPVHTKEGLDKHNASQALIYFPLAGLLLGSIAAGWRILSYLLSFDAFFSSVGVTVLLIILTGGLHLDGLADTTDAISSRKKRAEMLDIMRDSRIGTMGALAIICVLLIKIALLNSLYLHNIDNSLVMMCLMSRYAMVFSLFNFRYARGEGKAKIFFEAANRKALFYSTFISLVASMLIMKLHGLILFLITIPFAFFIGKYLAKKFGGITGDSLGAINELTEVFVLLIMVVINRGGI